MTIRVEAVLALAVLLVACQPRDGGWLPVLESAVPTYLERELMRATEDVEAGRAVLESAPEETAERLEEAAARLRSLSGVFLPLYRARIDAANAYRYHALDRDRDALDALTAVDEAIGAVARETGDAIEAELERVSAMAARSRVSLQSGSSEAAAHLETLSETLTDLVARAELIL